MFASRSNPQSKGLHLDCVKFWSAEIVSALEYLHCSVGMPVHCHHLR